MRAAAIDVPGHWLLGSLPELQRDQFALYRAGHALAGPVARFRGLPGLRWYAVYTPEGIERVLGSNQRNYRKPSFFTTPTRLLVGDGLLVSEGEPWLRRRRLMQPAFHRERLGAIAARMTEAAQAAATRWGVIAANREPVDVAQEMTRLTLRIVGTTLFGRDLSADADAAGEAVRVVLGDIGERMKRPLVLPPPWPTARNRRFVAARRVLDDVVHAVIAERRASGEERHDLLGMLLAARDEATGAGLSDVELRDELMTLLLAGHETSAAVLAWAWLRLGQHPDVEAALHAEVDAVLGGRAATLEDLPRLPYTRQVIDEVLRLHPPAWALPRQAIAADEIGGVAVPKGAIVVLVPFLAHRHPAHWDAPEAFDPARFTPARAVGRSRFAYVPFGAGGRICMGQQFALVEATIVLATLATRFRVRLDEAASMEPDATFTLRPRHGVPARLEDRAPRGRTTPPGSRIDVTGETRAAVGT